MKFKLNIWIIVILFFYLSPNILLAANCLIEGHVYSFAKAIMHAFISVLLILLPIIVFRLGPRIYFLMLSPLFAFIPVIIFIIIQTGKMPSKTIIYMALNASKTEIIAFTSGLWLWKFLIIALPVLFFLISYYKLPGKIKLNKKILFNYCIILAGFFIFTFFFKAAQINSFKTGIPVTFRFFVKDTPVQFTIRTYKVIKQMRRENSIQSYNSNGVKIKIRKSSHQQKINTPRSKE